MTIDLVGTVACGTSVNPGDKAGIVLFANSYVPLDADHKVQPYYYGGASTTHNVYVVIDKDDWQKYLATMRKLYPKLALKHYGKSLLLKAKDWHEQDGDVQEELNDKLHSFIKDFEDTAISQLRSISKSFDRYASDVEQDIKEAKATKWTDNDRVNGYRLNYRDRMWTALSEDWNTIAGVSNYQEPWAK